MKSTHHNIVNDIFIGFYFYDQPTDKILNIIVMEQSVTFINPDIVKVTVALTGVRR